MIIDWSKRSLLTPLEIEFNHDLVEVMKTSGALVLIALVVMILPNALRDSAWFVRKWDIQRGYLPKTKKNNIRSIRSINDQNDDLISKCRFDGYAGGYPFIRLR